MNPFAWFRDELILDLEGDGTGVRLVRLRYRAAQLPAIRSYTREGQDENFDP